MSEKLQDFQETFAIYRRKIVFLDKKIQKKEMCVAQILY